MTHPENGEFEDFEGDFKNVKKESPGGGAFGLVPEGVYKVACCKQDIKGDGELVDFEIFKANSGTKGFKLFLEILDPAEITPKGGEKVKTKGEVVEHVFWVTQKNLGYIKRDISAILGRDIASLRELETTVWVGKTCEVGIKHEVYRGFNQARVSFINAWKPGKSDGKAPASGASGKVGAGAPASGAEAGKEDGDPAF
jgi:hypothetical protein